MKLKTIEVVVDGQTITAAALDDKGLPIWIHDDGKEIGYDAKVASDTIKRLNGEAQTHRTAKEQAEEKLRGYEGIDDPAAARAALETVAGLSGGELKTAAQLEEMRTSITKAAEDKLAGVIKAKDDEIKKLTDGTSQLSTALDDEVIGGAFARSKFIEEKLVLPSDIVKAYFGAHFTRQDGTLIAKDSQGIQIFSREDPSRPATFDEALEVIVAGYSRKDSILKGEVGAGGGAGGGPGGKGGATMARAEFQRLSPADAGAKAALVREGKLTIVDA